jgi:hypothetical protein
MGALLHLNWRVRLSWILKGEDNLPPVRGRVGVDLTGLVMLEGSSWLARGFAARSWTVKVEVGVGSALGPDISQ